MKRRAAPKPAADFIKKKQKVGKTAQAPSNATQTLFKSRHINVPTQRLHEAPSPLSQSQSSSQSLASAREEVSLCLTKFHHHNTNVRRDAVNRCRELLAANTGILHYDLSSIVDRAAPLIIDADKPVRQSCLTFLTALTLALSRSQSQSVVRVLVSYVCSGLSHIEPTIRRSALDFLSLLIDRYPALILSHHINILPNLLSMVNDRLMTASAQLNTGGNDRYKGANEREKQNATGVNMANQQFRLQLLQTIERFTALCANGASDSGDDSDSSGKENVSSIVAESPASLAEHRMALQTLLKGTSVLDATDSQTQSEPTPLVTLTTARAVPLKYQRRGGMQGSKKSNIVHTNDDNFIDSLSSSPLSSAQSKPTTLSFATTLSLSVFAVNIFPSLIECWIESITVSESRNAHHSSSLTLIDYQCLLAIVSSLHECVKIVRECFGSDSGGVLGQYQSSMTSHLFSHFPLMLDSDSVAMIDTVAAVNAHLCHLITAMIIEPESVPESPSQSRSAEAGGESNSEWLTALIEYIGHAFYHRAETKATTNTYTINDSASILALTDESQPKRKRRAKDPKMPVYGVHLTQLLSVLPAVLPRLSFDRRVWLLESFTAYYESLNPLAPATLECVDLITAWLSADTDRDRNDWIRHPLGHRWLYSLPTILYRISDKSHVISHRILSLLQSMARRYHPSLFNIETMLPSLMPILTSASLLASLTVELQSMLLSLLHYCRMLPSPLLASFAQSINDGVLTQSVSTLVMELVASKRQSLGLSTFLSFLLSCIRHTDADSNSDPAFMIHPRTVDVVRRLHALASDPILQPTAADGANTAEVLMIVLAPVIEANFIDHSQIKLSLPTVMALLLSAISEVDRLSQPSSLVSPLPPALHQPVCDGIFNLWHRMRQSQSLSSAVVEDAHLLCIKLLHHCPSVLTGLLGHLQQRVGGITDESSQSSQSIIDTTIDCLTVLLQSQLLRTCFLDTDRSARVLALATAVKARTSHSLRVSVLRAVCELLYGRRAEHALG